MIATIIPEKKMHYPVMLNEIIDIISPHYGGTFIDCTFGQGGYSKKILEFKNTKVIALDRDQDVLKDATKLQNKYKERFRFENSKFSNLDKIYIDKKENLRGVIFDLGYSLKQIKDTNKGLSFESQGELNMQMGLNDFSAKETINKLDEKELEKIFKYFGEEKESKRISKKIISERKKNIITTQKLVNIIENSKRRKNYKIHSSTKVFQAIRIFVNKEISQLINGLINALKVIKKDGIIAVVTFHSLEDKIVKYFFKSLSENKSVSRYIPKSSNKKNILKLIKKKPILPSKEEIKINFPSRSAKLRYAIKMEDFDELKTDIYDKFSYLIEIENFSKKL